MPILPSTLLLELNDKLDDSVEVTGCHLKAPLHLCKRHCVCKDAFCVETALFNEPHRIRKVNARVWYDGGKQVDILPEELRILECLIDCIVGHSKRCYSAGASYVIECSVDCLLVVAGHFQHHIGTTALGHTLDDMERFVGMTSTAGSEF